ncbi:MAG: hypothetical protein K2F83_01115, partial [Oscillospiraceae bacterium]|nr:hypothetical protein [Oscillospiraceae bacterium]
EETKILMTCPFCGETYTDTAGHIYAGGQQIAAGFNSTFTKVYDAEEKREGWDKVKVLAWGDNSKGQLGNYGPVDEGKEVVNGTPVDRDNTVPRAVPGGHVLHDVDYTYMQGVTDFALGGSHMLLTTVNGVVFAAGDNTYGQLGDYTNKNWNYPIVVGDLAFETIVAMGHTDSEPTVRDLAPQVILEEDEALHFDVAKMEFLWYKGFNLLQHIETQDIKSGELKFQSLDTSLIDQVTTAGSDVIFRSPSATADDRVYGETMIQIYHPETGRMALLRVQVKQAEKAGQAYTTAPQVAVGARHTVALRSDGTVWAWGDNSGAQLGDNTFENRAYPVQMLDENGNPYTNIRAVAAGDSYSLLLTNEGEVIVVGMLTSITTNLLHNPSEEEKLQAELIRRNAENPVLYVYRLGDAGNPTYRTYTKKQLDTLPADDILGTAAGTLTMAYEWRNANNTVVANPSQADIDSGRVTKYYLGWAAVPTEEQKENGYKTRYYAAYKYINDLGDDCGTWLDIPEICPICGKPETLTQRRVAKTAPIIMTADLGATGDKEEETAGKQITAIDSHDLNQGYKLTYMNGTETVALELTTVYTNPDGEEYFVTENFETLNFDENGDPKDPNGIRLYDRIMVNKSGLTELAGTYHVRKWGERTYQYYEGILTCNQDCGLGRYNPLDKETPLRCPVDGCNLVGQGNFHELYADDHDVWPNHAEDMGWHAIPEEEWTHRYWYCANRHIWAVPYDRGNTEKVPERKTLTYATGEVDVEGVALEAPLKDIIDIAAGTDHVLMLAADGTVWAAGSNDNGELGQDSVEKLGTAVQVKGFKAKGKLNYVVDVVAGDGYSAALLANGTVFTWGRNDMGQLGDNSRVSYSATPVQVVSGDYDVNDQAIFNVITGVNAITAGDSHVVVIASEFKGLGVNFTAEKSVFAWGDNSKNQLNRGESLSYSRTPVRVAGLSENRLRDDFDGARAVTVDAGKAHTLIRLSDGRVLAFGNNDRRQLTKGEPDQYGIVLVEDGEAETESGHAEHIIIAAAGGNHSVLVTEDGHVLSFGDNTKGQLGLAASGTDDLADDWRDEPFYTGEQAAEILNFNFGGNPNYSNTGYNRISTLWNVNKNIYISILDEVALTEYFGFNLLSNDPTTSTQSLSERYPGLQFLSSDKSILEVYQDAASGEWRMRSAGLTYSSFQKIGEVTVAAVDANGNVVGLFMVKVNGTNQYTTDAHVPGTGNRVATPMVVSSGTATLALKADGTVWTWGTGAYYEEDGTIRTCEKPTQLFLSNIVQIAAGDHHYVALDNNGAVWTWGDNTYGQTGIYESTQVFYKYIVNELSNRDEPKRNAVYRYARKMVTLPYSSDPNKSWQDLRTQLLDRKQSDTYNKIGESAYDPENGPFTEDEVFGKIVAIAAGANHTLLLDENGNVWAFGDNTYGQLGVGDTGYDYTKRLITINDKEYQAKAARYTPTKVLQGVSASRSWYLENVISISAGGNYSAAVLANGTAWTWGSNSKGQLGVVASGSVVVPVAVSGSADQKTTGSMKNIVSVAAGREHTLIQAVVPKAEGEGFTMGAYAVGDNSDGRLGIGIIYTYICPDCGEKFHTGDAEVSGSGVKVMLTHQEARQAHEGKVMRNAEGDIFNKTTTITKEL